MILHWCVSRNCSYRCNFLIFIIEKLCTDLILENYRPEGIRRILKLTVLFLLQKLCKFCFNWYCERWFFWLL
jgi:hypothetical protein